MSEVVSRLYSSSSEAAQDAAGVLRKAGYQPHELVVLSRPEGDEAAARDAVMASARKMGVFKRRAAELADGVAGGATAVVCRARFANAIMVRNVLDNRGPIDAGNNSGRSTSSEAEAGLFSDLFGIPLLGGRGDFFSNLFGLSAISKRQRGSAALVGKTGPYKPFIPFPTLSRSDGNGGYRPSIPLPLLTSRKGGYQPVVPMPTLTRADRGGYSPVVPMPLLTGKDD